ncbi:MAG: 30S ribosomal protein S20 [Clostridia bacterium]|nr:30S ribosomal protein S20 [Clostridia bacterium]
MANIKSAKKRIKVNEAKAAQNKALKSALKTAMKKYEAAVAAGNMEVAETTYKATVKRIDQAVAHGFIHKNNAARKKSRFTKMLNDAKA